ncbi:MAG: hypothetical protein IID45_08885 [Planctomycetes bacterium]|nr:hypothetical protein [Planctomycetota bacterium]
MGKLSDILHDSGSDDFRDQWENTAAAGEFGPLPAGEYVARIVSGELFNAEKKDTPGYKLKFSVLEGEYVDRLFWHDLWLTPAALPMTKRDLLKIGIESPDQLEQPVPPGIRCPVKLALRRDDDGNESNRVVRFDVIGVDEPEPDEFAPGTGDTGDEKSESGTNNSEPS